MIHKSTKPSGIEWIGNVPAEWEVKPAKYILESNQSTLKETTKADYSFKYIDIGSVDFDKGIIGYEEMSFDNAPSRARRIVKKGDTLISTVRTYLKAIARIEDDKDVIVSTGFAVLSPKTNDSVFIEYYCKSDAFCSEIEKLSYGIAYPAINESVLINIKMLLPPPKEQQAIAAFLDTRCDRIDRIITEMEQQIEVLKSYKTSLITETVTKGLNKSVPMKPSGIDWIGEIPAHWEVKKMKYVAVLYPPCNSKHLTFDSDVTFLPMEYIKNGYYLDNVTKLEDLNGSYNCFCNGDILLAKVTPCFENGNIAIAENLSNNFGFGSSELFVIRTKSCNNKFLFYLFQSHAFIDKAISTMTGVAGLKRVSPVFVENYTFGLPSLKEQQSIAAFLDNQCSRINNLITEKHQSIETMKAYKKSLIHEYITGKKRVKGYP